MIVDQISPRNSRRFRGQRTYVDLPDTLRVRFSDETNSWESTEKIIPWLRHEGPIDLTEELSIQGKTDPDEVEIEAVRRMHEVSLRPDRFSVIQDGAARVATRGDMVMLSHYVLDSAQVAARVVLTEGAAAELDEEFQMIAGQIYALRFRVFDGVDDVIGASVVAQVSGTIGTTRLVTILDTVDRPYLGEDSFAAHIIAVEPAEDMAVHLARVNGAPGLDALAVAHVVSDWTPIIGEASPSFGLPSVSELAGIDIDGTEIVIGASVTGSDAIYIRSIRVEHRMLGAAAGDTAEILGSSGAAAATQNIGLSRAATVDGVVLTDGSRVLVTGQSDGTQNGIYIVETAGAWSRAPGG
ncbi:hypothetical protein [Pelagimonas varians]|uniref:Uncharacterized protein n=1 Tax=Pelagimonas varians TaxID=696760 RepID=A0A238KYG3_9RHOB|nr:hypothetical protein [Pelagimonas varians]PYG27834.1 hypothetical protein C8N36_114110 [Pelagimonas varians]SMX47680.1 hypothetical protein PEV8663_03609 [Pelagimonas varians]